MEIPIGLFNSSLRQMVFPLVLLNNPLALLGFPFGQMGVTPAQMDVLER